MADVEPPVDHERSPLNVDERTRRWDLAVGVGGIGSGQFVMLDGNRTLGREESRAGRFLDARDYCKLHIVGHYLQTLLGHGFRTVPIGLVGRDASGQRLLDEMRLAGMETTHVRQVAAGTLHSICLVYPDGGGGNVTASDSASSLVDRELVSREMANLKSYGSRAIALALPEVPLEARFALLDEATGFGAFRVASFTTEEIANIDPDSWRRIDLLAINVDEAGGLVGISGDPPQPVAESVASYFEGIAPSLLIAMTAGEAGSWTWDGADLRHRPAVSAGTVLGTGGAGDAFLAGLLVGLCGRLNLADAHDLAALVAAVAVTSQHSIHPRLDRTAIRAAAPRAEFRLLALVYALMGA